MEVCSPCNTADHIGSCMITRSSQDPSSQSHHNSGSLSMSDLKACLTGLQNNEGFVLSKDVVYSSSGENGEDTKLVDNDKTEHQSHYSEKHLSKSATFPQSSGLKPSVCKAYCEIENHENGKPWGVHGLNGSAKEFAQPCSRSLSLPVSLKPVSALKGSRERQGVSPKKLTVTWAPEVYDPIPTSASHVPSSKPQRYRGDGKKSRKNKQRSSTKSSGNGGNKGKDKKCKNSGRSYVVKPFHEETGVVVSGKELMLETQLRSAEIVF